MTRSGSATRTRSATRSGSLTRSVSAGRKRSAARLTTRDYVDRGEFTDLVELITPIIFPDAKSPTKKDLKMAFIQVRTLV